MARDFDGATGNLARSGVVSVATNNFTICAWIMVDVAQAGGIITNGFDGGSGAGWRLRINADPSVRMTLNFVVSLNGTTVLTLGRWYHCLGVRDAGTTSLYVDGVSEGGTTASAPTAPATYFRIGCNINNAGTNVDFFSGKVVETGVWERALTTTEITNLASGYAPSFFPQNLVHYAPITGADSPEDDKKSTTNLTVTAAPRFAHPDFMKYPNKPSPNIIIRPRAFAPGLAR